MMTSLRFMINIKCISIIGVVSSGSNTNIVRSDLILAYFLHHAYGIHQSQHDYHSRYWCSSCSYIMFSSIDCHICEEEDFK